METFGKSVLEALSSVECYHPPAYRLTKEFVDEFHNEGLRVNAWFGLIQTD